MRRLLTKNPFCSFVASMNSDGCLSLVGTMLLYTCMYRDVFNVSMKQYIYKNSNKQTH